jgi:flavin reductase (DIM6/NTAB) family NADH-FMN oxidoreductase RutF
MERFCFLPAASQREIISPCAIFGKAFMASSSPTPELFRRLMGSFATGVTVITAQSRPGRVHGMTANSFTSVSLNPLLILVCVDHNARLLTFIKERLRFGVNILKESQQSFSEHFANPLPSPGAEESLGIRFHWTSTGIPLLEDALGSLACNVVAEHLAGDHSIFIGEVESVELGEGQPLLYYHAQYRRLR